MIFIVDGTGESDDKAYAREMAGGFCKQLETKLKNRSWYRRGPTFWGTETTGIANEVVKAVMDLQCSVSGVGEKVFLGGHSRGGAAVIFAAHVLKEKGIPIEAMFLFDAVDRTVNFKSASRIPANVKNVLPRSS